MFDTRLVARSASSINGHPWELRAVHVTPSTGWLEVIYVPVAP